MKDKREETLLKIEDVINKWKSGDLNEETALDDVYDLMSELSDWEEEEYQRRRKEEWERNSITVKAKVRYMGKLPVRPIDFDEEK